MYQCVYKSVWVRLCVYNLSRVLLVTRLGGGLTITYVHLSKYGYVRLFVFVCSGVRV